jgi:hypothetical protein
MAVGGGEGCCVVDVGKVETASEPDEGADDGFAACATGA